ncbi:MAG: sigma-70 family RNA polymerase sigma factor [Actinomycetota bacterium]|nr:sigma-70 family RNA polymerase sigma factor [Actinomycetota bacterium]
MTSAAAPTPKARPHSAAVAEELVARARTGGPLSLDVLRATFDAAGLSPREARTVLAAVAEAGAALEVGKTSSKPSRSSSRRQAAPAVAVPAQQQRKKKVARSEPAVAQPPAAPSVEPPAPEAAVEIAVEETEVVDLDTPAPTEDLVRSYLQDVAKVKLLTAEQEVELAQRIEAGLFAAHLLEQVEQSGPAVLRDLPGRPTVDELRRLVADGQRAKEHMLTANLRLVVSAAKKFQNRGLDMLDLVQEGNLGLIRAVEKFDWRAGFKFSTYAMWWLRQSMTRALADQSRTIRVPVHVAEQLSKLARLRRHLIVELGREPAVEELAAAMDLSIDKMSDLIALARDPMSLDSPIGDDADAVVGDLIVDTGVIDAERAVEFAALRTQIDNLLGQLPDREATVMRLRFGLADGNEHSLQQIGERLGLTRERIRQIEKATVARLRELPDAHRLLELVA